MRGKVLTWIRGKRKWLDPNEPPKEVRELDMFVWQHIGSKPFVKVQGGWYKVTRHGQLLFVARTLYLLTLQEWLDIAKNDNFIANFRT